MSPRGGLRSNPGGRPPGDPDDRRIPRTVGLSIREFRASHDSLEPGEEWPDHVREAIATLPRVRATTAWIHEQMEECTRVEMRTDSKGVSAQTAATQRRTLAAVLARLEGHAPAKRRPQLQGGG